MAVLAILISLLIPALHVAKERSRRVVCSSTVRRFISGLHVYAQGNADRLVSGQSDNPNPDDEHTPVLSSEARKALVRVLGDEKTLLCPSMGEPFNQEGGWYYPQYGYVIGYNYLGGHAGTPWPILGSANATWKSPSRMSDDSSAPVVTELNAWSEADQRTWAPHGRRGGILMGGPGQQPGGMTAAQAGAAGGNVGLLDGSVSWRAIEDTKVYRGSRLHGEDACFTSW